MNILKRLKYEGFHTSIIASYSCDLPFYEGIVQSTLRSYGCLNNFLLVDVNTYSRSLPTLGNLAKEAGNLYSVIPIRTSGAFHPKLILQLGEKKGRLFLGSANASVDGFGRNREMMFEISCTAEASPEQSLIAQAYDYLLSFMETHTLSSSYKISTLQRDTPWLEKAQRATGPIELEDGQQVDLICGPEQGIADQFVKLIGDDKIKRLISLAPFWDSKLSALSFFMEALKPTETNLIVQSETVNFKWQSLEKLPDSVSIHEPQWASSGDQTRYLHAKLYVVEGELFDYLLMGSSNCSFAALGNERVPGLNAEACIFRRVPAGTAYAHLSIPCELTKESALEKAAIEKLEYQEEEKPPGEGTPHPGHLEVLGSKVILTTSSELKTPVVSLQLLDNFFEDVDAIPFEKKDSDKLIFSGTKVSRKTSRFGKVLLEDGTYSKPVILHYNEALKKAAPGKAGTKLNSLFEKVRLGESSFLSMLEPFQKIFFNTSEKATEDKQTKTKQASTGQKKKEESTLSEEPTSTMTYEEFIASRVTPAKVDESLVGTTGTEAAIFIDFLRKRYSSQIDSDSSIVELESEEIPEEELDETPQVQAPPKALTVPPPAPVEQKAIDKERANTKKLIENYVKWADQKIRDYKYETTSEDVAGLWGLLSIISHLAFIRFPVNNENNYESIFNISDPDAELYFPNNIAKVMGHFFFNGHSPLIKRINIPDDSPELPTEHFGAWTMCFWSLCASMEIASQNNDQREMEDLESLAYIVYQKTGLSRKGLDENDVTERLKKIHEMVVPTGRSPFIEQILEWHNWFLQSSRIEKDSAKEAPQPLEVGDRVWPLAGGPRYIRALENDNALLNFPGVEDPSKKDYCKRFRKKDLVKLEPTNYSSFNSTVGVQSMNEIALTSHDQVAYIGAMEYVTKWCKNHQWEVGVAEMALGAAAIAWGVQNGTIEMGKDIVASQFSDNTFGLGSAMGAAGTGLGSLGASVLGNIGVAAMGGAIGIPAILLIGGGGIILGAVGYTAGDLAAKFLGPEFNYEAFFADASVMAVGTALLIDGARRAAKDPDTLHTAARVKEGVIYLADLTTEVVASSRDELKDLIKSLATTPEDAVDATGSVVSGAAVAATGTAIGGSIAAGSVTVLGSHSLGAAAISLGLVSAPAWPVIAGGAAGLAIGYTAWKAARHLAKKGETEG